MASKAFQSSPYQQFNVRLFSKSSTAQRILILMCFMSFVLWPHYISQSTHSLRFPKLFLLWWKLGKVVLYLATPTHSPLQGCCIRQLGNQTIFSPTTADVSWPAGPPQPPNSASHTCDCVTLFPTQHSESFRPTFNLNFKICLNLEFCLTVHLSKQQQTLVWCQIVRCKGKAAVGRSFVS